MNDLDTDSKLPNSPSEKSKFHFKFPLVHLHHHSAPNEPESNPAGIDLISLQIMRTRCIFDLKYILATVAHVAAPLIPI